MVNIPFVPWMVWVRIELENAFELPLNHGVSASPTAAAWWVCPRLPSLSLEVPEGFTGASLPAVGFPAPGSKGPTRAGFCLTRWKIFQPTWNNHKAIIFAKFLQSWCKKMLCNNHDSRFAELMMCWTGSIPQTYTGFHHRFFMCGSQLPKWMMRFRLKTFLSAHGCDTCSDWIWQRNIGGSHSKIIMNSWNLSAVC